MAHGTFATAINCMDGRTQLAVTAFMKSRYGVDFVDMITEPGPVRALAEAVNLDLAKKLAEIESLMKRLRTAFTERIENPMAAIAFAEAGEYETALSLMQFTTAHSIKKRLDISVNGHGSHAVAIAAHHDCAGNPVAKDIQVRQLALAAETVNNWRYDADIITLWVDENWQVNVIQ